MSKKYAELIGDWLVELGYTHCFLLPGGGCMHLVDSFRSRFECIPVVHEVTAGIAVEHFNESCVEGKAFALVTTGPGLTNVVTAIAGAYVERRELLIIAGQVKASDLLTAGLRQRGIQEVDGSTLVKPISLASMRIDHPINRQDFADLVSVSSCPHPGPVVLEICLDTQGERINDSEKLTSVDPLRGNDTIRLRDGFERIDEWGEEVAVR
jgi:acetolactate synthase-1/2/3 large subunit